MLQEKQKSAVYLKVKDCKLIHDNVDGTSTHYEFFEGVLTDVKSKTVTTDKSTFVMLTFYFRDGDETIALSLSPSSSVTTSIFKSLMSTNYDIKEKLRISVYKNSKGYPSVGMTQNSKRVDWNDKTIPVSKVSVDGFGNKSVDHSDILNYNAQAMNTVLAKIEKSKSSNQQTQQVQQNVQTQQQSFGQNGIGVQKTAASKNQQVQQNVQAQQQSFGQNGFGDSDELPF